MLYHSNMRHKLQFNLQIKIFLILIGVIVPTSFLLGFVQHRLLSPVMDEELKQVGTSFAQTLASQIETGRLLQKQNAPELIEARIQRMMYTQPSIVRVDVYARANTGKSDEARLINLASSVVDAEDTLPPMTKFIDQPEYAIEDDEGVRVWSIKMPVKSGSERAVIHVLVSLKLVELLRNSILRFNLIAALLSTVILILLLSYFLRRVIQNERSLQSAQAKNEQLTGRLQEIQGELIHKEKLAVMGQLTAQFAHEIGTPLNAIGGTLQLLKMDYEKNKIAATPAAEKRMEIISGQIKKIETIVKRFLKTTKSPVNEERKPVSLIQTLESVLSLLAPTLDKHQIKVHSDFSSVFKTDREWITVVPIDIEQVILNLINNAIDSMKGQVGDRQLTLSLLKQDQGCVLSVMDTGHGITDEDLKRVFKPFFTTKTIGEGHGLGLSICQEILRSYGYELTIRSKINVGTTIEIVIPV